MQRLLSLATALCVAPALFVVLGFFAMSPAALSAQEGVRQVPPLYRGPVTRVQGVFVTPIAGAPFSAVVVIESRRPLPDGTVEKRHSQVQIARDSRGRIHNEMHALVSDGFQGTPPLLSTHIFDPQTRISYFLDPSTMIARMQVIAPPRQLVGTSNANTQELGFSEFNGMQAKGTRVTRTVPEQFSGTGKSIEVTDEFWYSEELHMNLLERHTDVRGGEQTVGILSIKREEPAPALFEVPAGYKVVDLTPAANSPAGRQIATH